MKGEAQAVDSRGFQSDTYVLAFGEQGLEELTMARNGVGNGADRRFTFCSSKGDDEFGGTNIDGSEELPSYNGWMGFMDLLHSGFGFRTGSGSPTLHNDLARPCDAGSHSNVRPSILCGMDQKGGEPI